jgi:tRNA threonylcarbamoyl adenosine modification protein YjeE
MSGSEAGRRVETSEQMEALGRELGARLRAGDLVVLSGPLGAGKTTMTRGIGAALAVRGPIQSPTFVLARSHPALDGGTPLVHVDAYRLGSAMELDDLDIDFAGSVVVVEWGAGLLDGVAESWLEVDIERPRAVARPDAGGSDADEPELDEPRTVRFTGHGPRWLGGPSAADLAHLRRE